MRLVLAAAVTVLSISSIKADEKFERTGDWRDIRTGRSIPAENYCDQPYVVIRDDGAWVLTMTTGPGSEGDEGQHIVARISKDRGKTWSNAIPIEPSSGPEASWAVPFRTPDGRIYVFYTYNDTGITDRRADLLGSYVFRYSDDGGRTWSEKRYRIPNRVTAFDRNNQFDGRVQMGWGVGKPVVQDGSVYLPWTKIGKYLVGKTEGWVFRSDNLLNEKDPKRIEWTMLPPGESGIRAPEGGPIASEHHLVTLSNGTLYDVFRTTGGHPGYALSEDGGRNWTDPAYLRYEPDGRRIKHPRACPAMEKMPNGKYLLWHHNHSGKTYQHRNPVWLSGGVERNGTIHWSEPEIVLYHPDPDVRISYPDFFKDEGRYWFTETQKSRARVHRIRRELLNDLWHQHRLDSRITKGRVLEATGASLQGSHRMPDLPDLSGHSGFTLDFWLTLDRRTEDRVLLDTRNEDGTGFMVRTTGRGSVELTMTDENGRTGRWSSDPGLLTKGKRHHVVAMVDGGPNIISFVVDGRLCDGRDRRQYGWGRFPRELRDVSGGRRIELAPSLNGQLHSLRIYDRALRTSEAVSNYRAGP